MASKLGHKPIVTILLANGAELNSQDHFVEYPKGKQGSTPLIEATREGFIEIMQQLISKGADINKIDELSEKWDLTALIAASAENNLDAVKLLVENGADLNIGRLRKCKVDKAGSLDKGTALDFTFDSEGFIPGITCQDIETDPIMEPCILFLDCLPPCPAQTDETSTYEYLQEKGALPSLPQSCGYLGIR